MLRWFNLIVVIHSCMNTKNYVLEISLFFKLGGGKNVRACGGGLSFDKN